MWCGVVYFGLEWCGVLCINTIKVLNKPHEIKQFADKDLLTTHCTHGQQTEEHTKETLQGVGLGKEKKVCVMEIFGRDTFPLTFSLFFKKPFKLET